MNTPNNKRRKESIERIEKAFINLIQKRDIEEVTVSDICKRAEINRTTFYANYSDIHALADSIKHKLENDMRDVVYNEELTKGYNSNDYLKLFRYIKDNQLFFKTYFKLGYDNEYKIFTYDYRLAEEHFNSRFIEYHIEFFRAGLNKIIKMWLENGCKESPEDMNEILNSEYKGRKGASLDQQ